MTTALSVIRTEVLDSAGLDSTDPRLTSAVLNRFINRGLRRLTSINDWPWNDAQETITTVGGTATATPAADWSRTINMQLNSIDLRHISPHEAGKYFSDTGRPLAFSITNELITFYPTPTGVYSITHNYSTYEATLTGDSDTPALPDAFIDALVSHTLLLVSTKIRDTELYTMASRDVKDWEDRMADDTQRATGALRVTARSDWLI